MSAALKLGCPLGLDIRRGFAFLKAQQQLVRKTGPLLGRELEGIRQQVIRGVQAASGRCLDGPFRADAARVRQTQRARGPDIYGERTVVREIYALRGRVRPGNSGGPLLDGRGDVLGVIFAAAADDPQTGYALTAAEVAPVADRGRTSSERVASGRCD